MMILLQLLMMLSLVTMGISVISPPGTNEKVCTGTNVGLSYSGSAETRYEKYRRRYTNCTIVHGNLEINKLDERDDYDLSFLSDIRGVTGYVIIANLLAESIPLHNLRVIRGWSLYKRHGNTHALYVAFNYLPSHPDVGLKHLALDSLHEIMAGDVYIRYNDALCFQDTILWQDILAGGGFFVDVRAEEDPTYCGDCDPSCYSDFDGFRHCYGPGPEQCQELRRVECDSSCPGFCFGFGPNECCHEECAGGCDGPSNDNCWACQNFDDDGVCVPNCPQERIYDYQQHRVVVDPNHKYSFGSLCVEECPAYMSVLVGSCVKECGHLMTDVNGICQFCDGPCPKRCEGTDYYFLHGGSTNKPGSIQQFEGCTVIEGSLSITNLTFSGNPYDGIPGIDVADLGILRNVRTITGYLFIEADRQQFTNLSFLGDLRTIIGQELGRHGDSVHIVHTSLTSLGLTSLEHIENGHVIIYGNSDLCYSSSINWGSLMFTTSRQQRLLARGNKNSEDCERLGAVCDVECSVDGCWGAGPSQCLSCEHDELTDGTCIRSCADLTLHYSTGNGTCAPCHVECAESCSGPGADACTTCAHVRDGARCVSKCPRDAYVDADAEGQATCQPCHDKCDGCVGPSQQDCLRCRNNSNLYLLHTIARDTSLPLQFDSSRRTPAITTMEC